MVVKNVLLWVWLYRMMYLFTFSVVGEFIHKVSVIKEQTGHQLLSAVESFRRKGADMKKDRLAFLYFYIFVLFYNIDRTLHKITQCFRHWLCVEDINRLSQSKER